MKKAFILFLVFGLLCSTTGIAYNTLPLVEKAEDTYAYAEELMGTGEYKEAAQYFDSISAYRDASKQGMYCKACALCEEGTYEMGLKTFELLADFKDSPFRLTYYTARSWDERSVDVTELEGMEKAKALYEQNPLFLDSLERIAALEKRIETAKALQPTPAPTPVPTPAAEKQYPFAQANIGDYIVFGAYEQDNNTKNGKEDIEWLVLNKVADRILVISRYALACKPYNISNKNVTWETCTLRTWLNNDFLKVAFSSAEQDMIPTVTVAAHKNPDYSTKPGNDTQDRVFLLSSTEAEKYFSSDSAMSCEPTAYAKKQGAYTNSDGFSRWWLRSPGYIQNYAASIREKGGFSENGYGVNISSSAVRPALWIYFGSGALPEGSINFESATAKPISEKTSNKATPKPTQAPCSECGGDGKLIVSCNKCGGDGKTESQCATCSGSGLRRCTSCSAKGYKSCGSCGGDGATRCWHCSGRGTWGGKTCSQCNGSGGETCYKCSGAGITVCSSCYGAGAISCGMCNGRGKNYFTCSSCNGGGTVYKKCTKCQ